MSGLYPIPLSLGRKRLTTVTKNTLHVPKLVYTVYVYFVVNIVSCTYETVYLAARTSCALYKFLTTRTDKTK